MKKFFVLLVSLLMFIPLSINAVSEVDYDIIDMIVDATVNVNGDVHVKEVIVLDGSFNGYIRDLMYENESLPSFDGSKESFEGSSIYNGSGISLIDLGTVNYFGDANYDIFNSEVNTFVEGNGYNGASGIFERSEFDGLSLKMYEETNNSVTAFYIEYIVRDVAVLHNDVGEVYYNFIGYGFDDKIERLRIKLNLPGFTTGDVRVWAHGPLNGEVSLVAEGDNKYGSYAYIEDLSSNTPVDLRMTYPKELLVSSEKVSGVDALDTILLVEGERADAANRERLFAKIMVISLYVGSGLYIIGLIGVVVFAYKKYDKEYKSSFIGEYYRDIIEEYEVPAVEYLMKKKIGTDSFSASIMNMIYKKNISVKKGEGKKDYTFTKENEMGVTEDEMKIMNLLFNEIGIGNSVTMNEIKKFAKKTSSSGNNEFLNRYNSWVNSTTSKSKDLGFYEDNKKQLKLLLYTLIGLVLFIYSIYLDVFLIAAILLILTSCYFIYIIVMSKRTKKGSEHYAKWKAFKKFLEDFGRMDEKDLPEVVLWEKYLVYATVLGVADKVSEAMEIKMKDMGYDRSDIYIRHYTYTSLSRDLSTSVKSSHSSAVSAVNAARSSSSSGSGGGGGFSGGGGFGGGGGGGRGF